MSYSQKWHHPKKLLNRQNPMNPNNLTRRAFVTHTTTMVAGTVVSAKFGSLNAQTASDQGPYQAMGTRAGEVTDTTAIVWTRLTAAPKRVAGTGLFPKGKRNGAKQQKPLSNDWVDQLEGACPGAPGRVQLRYGTCDDLSDATVTKAISAVAENDFICEFKLSGLKPGTTYFYKSEIPGTQKEADFRGKFETAPAVSALSNFRFCVMTCQDYSDRGHLDGHEIYPAMAACKPQFTCLTGDLVYYDKGDEIAESERLARYHWERMFSLPRLVDFNSNHSTYWLQDD